MQRKMIFVFEQKKNKTSEALKDETLGETLKEGVGFWSAEAGRLVCLGHVKAHQGLHTSLCFSQYAQSEFASRDALHRMSPRSPISAAVF